jgi:hypothetical protein
MKLVYSILCVLIIVAGILSLFHIEYTAMIAQIGVVVLLGGYGFTAFRKRSA